MLSGRSSVFSSSVAIVGGSSQTRSCSRGWTGFSGRVQTLGSCSRSDFVGFGTRTLAGSSTLRDNKESATLSSREAARCSGSRTSSAGAIKNETGSES